METLRWKDDPNWKTMNGLAVKRFQEFGEEVIGNTQWLEENGGGWGNDGWFGEDSHNLAILVQEELNTCRDVNNKLDVDGIVGPKTWEAIFEKLGRTESGAKVYHRGGVKIVDGRGIWVPKSHYTGIRRPWTGNNRNVMKGMVLHQTGCWMPETPEVWAKINCHCGITRKGVIILMFPFDYFIWHSHATSRNQAGIEIAGLFKGVENSTNTWWPKDAKTHNLTDEQFEASEVLFKIIKEEFDKNGGKWETLYAHRQSSEMRMSDPGEEIWKRIGMPWLERLGATDGGDDFKTGTGYSIPKEWNPAYTNTFWKK